MPAPETSKQLSFGSGQASQNDSVESMVVDNLESFEIFSHKFQSLLLAIITYLLVYCRVP